jgi:hypothetical protein
MNYTLHQLKIFSVVAKLGSITRASEQLQYDATCSFHTAQEFTGSI